MRVLSLGLPGHKWVASNLESIECDLKKLEKLEDVLSDHLGDAYCQRSDRSIFANAARLAVFNHSEDSSDLAEGSRLCSKVKRAAENADAKEHLKFEFTLNDEQWEGITSVLQAAEEKIKIGQARASSSGSIVKK